MMEWFLFQWFLLLHSPTIHEAIITFLLLLPVLSSLLYRLYAKIRRRNGRSVGLQILSHSSSDDGVKYELVAVHGLGADPEHTWTCKPSSKSNSDKSQGRVHLLKDLLMKDERFSDTRILHFAYNSDWLIDACFESAHDIGLRLIESLTEHRKSHARLPMIFVGHSFGGIVIKEALASSREDSYEILEDTCGIIFLGTPHLGSPVAGWGASIAYLTSFLGSDTGLLLSLRSNEEMLVNLSKRFQTSVSKKIQGLSKKTALVSILEKKPTYLLNWLYAGMIVPWQSAKFDADLMSFCEVDKDHSGLNKCLNSEDPLYKELTTQICDMRPITPPKMNKIQQAVIDRLAPVTACGAEFHPSLDEHGRGHLECFPQTRVEVLKDIYDWLDGRVSPHKHLYWLHGKAGTGKSAIARTVVSRMIKENHIVANFFFKRGEGDRTGLKRLVTTLATQFARKSPTLAKSVQDALDSEPSLPEHDPRVQFKRLIRGPIEEPEAEVPKAMVVVIDALDECDLEDDLATLVQLLLQPVISRNGTQSSSSRFRVKYFVTSRLDYHTQSDFNKVPEEKGEKKGLEEITSDFVEQDIERYLQVQLEKIDNLIDPHSGGDRWSNPNDVQNRKELAKLAGPLFEFAATACRYIANKRIPGGPKNRLQDILESKACGDLRGVYLPILNHRFHGLESQYLCRAKEQFEDVIGSFLGLADSVTIPCLVELTGLGESCVRDELQHFESVLIIPPKQDHQSCVELFHESFRDFLIGSMAHESFKFDTKRIHEGLATRCRRLLHHALHENIGKLQRPGAHRSEVSRTVIEKNLPPEVQYACRFWIYHVKKSQSTIEDDDVWYTFLSTHFLQWLEALSFLDRISESALLIKELQTIVHPTKGAKVMGFLRDAERFILSFRSIIDIAPLQLYSSALTFAPTDSMIRKTFQAHRSSWIIRAPNVASQWSPSLQTFEGHDTWVNCVAFSSEGLFASGDGNGIVKIWDPISGTCQQSFRVSKENQRVCALAFSGTGELACKTINSISIWDTSQNFELRMFLRNSRIRHRLRDEPVIRNDRELLWERRCIHSQNFDEKDEYYGPSHQLVFLYGNRLLLVHKSKAKVLVWEPGHDFREHSYQSHSQDSAPIISFDGQWVAWIGEEEIKLIETFKSDCQQHVLPATGDFQRGMWTACFSRDNQYFALGNYNKTVMVWSITPPKLLQTFTSDEYIASLTFSPDNRNIATASFHGRIATWDWEKRICLQTFIGHHSDVTALAYSISGVWLASASRDHTIKIWDAAAPISKTVDTRHNNTQSIAMAKGGQQLVTNESNLWDAFGSKCVSRPTKDDGDNTTGDMAVISANGEMLAAAKHQDFQVWSLGTHHGSPPRGSCFPPISHSERARLRGGRAVAIHSEEIHQEHIHSERNRPAFDLEGPCLRGFHSEMTSLEFDLEVLRQFRSEETPSGLFFEEYRQNGVLSRKPRSERIRSIALSADGKKLVIGTVSGEVKLLDSRTSLLVHKIHDRRLGPDVRIAISSDGEQIASAGNGLIRVEGHMGKSLTLHATFFQTIENIGFSQNGERLAAISSDWSGTIWDLATGAPLRKFKGGLKYSERTWSLDISFINFDFTAVVTGSPEEQPREDCLIKYHISPDGVWLMRHAEKLLWLPPDYRPSAAAASDSTIAIGLRSGRPIVIGLSEDGPHRPENIGLRSLQCLKDAHNKYIPIRT